MVEYAPALMGRQLDSYSSKRLQETLEQSGVKVILQAGVTSIEGTEVVTGVTLNDGTSFPCDHVVYSIGIVPNTALVDGSEIEVRSGIIVDEHLQTSAPNIYAAGDVAEFGGLVEGLWGGAMEQGRIAGSNMAEARVYTAERFR